jgi:hypothetical protein
MSFGAGHVFAQQITIKDHIPETIIDGPQDVGTM